MNSTSLFALAIAVGSGVAIGFQSLLTNLTGQVITPVRASFWIHASGSVVGLVVMGVLVIQGKPILPAIENPGRLWLYVLLAGVAGIAIVTGVAFSFRYIGQTAGQVAILMGQMGIAVAVDLLGVAGEPIPLDWRRIAGLLLMAAAIYFLLPQQAS